MIYLDNAATTYYKPKSVLKALSKNYANPGRGGHRLSLEAGEAVFSCRQALADFFNVSAAESIIFTCNTTEALNVAIKGFLKKDDHVIISSMEHNSVVRPLSAIGAEISVAQADGCGRVHAETIKKLIRDDTKLICVTHASNLVGTINPIPEIGAIAHENNIKLLVDAAQTAGVTDIDVMRDNIDMLAFAGHKMLFGPQGTGGLYISPEIELIPLKEGGTGSVSEQYEQPDFLPDRFESGTLNTSGIAGLHEGIKFINKIGIESIKKKEQYFTKYLIDQLAKINGVKLYGEQADAGRVGVVGFNIKNLDSVEVCNALSEDYDIASRAGMHCAPLAHKTMGTLDTGMIRFSVSWFTKLHELDRAIQAVGTISDKY